MWFLCVFLCLFVWVLLGFWLGGFCFVQFFWFDCLFWVVVFFWGGFGYFCGVVFYSCCCFVLFFFVVVVLGVLGFLKNIYILESPIKINVARIKCIQHTVHAGLDHLVVMYFQWLVENLNFATKTL